MATKKQLKHLHLSEWFVAPERDSLETDADWHLRCVLIEWLCDLGHLYGTVNGRQHSLPRLPVPLFRDLRFGDLDHSETWAQHLRDTPISAFVWENRAQLTDKSWLTEHMKLQDPVEVLLTSRLGAHLFSSFSAA